MKLAELLALELKVWPEGSVCSTQEGNYSAYFWKSSDVHFDKGGWDHASGYGLISQGWSHSLTELATDHATAIVTRADWEAEVARLAQPQESQWIRHRGGKCPVEAGVSVEYRMRDGEIMSRPAGSLEWDHYGECGDIMAYRICEPEQASDAVVEHDIYADDTEPSLSPVLVTYTDQENPLIWRDRIREIDITVEALEEERASLVQQLEDEGFRLIGEAAEPVGDMSDWRNWQAGDLLVVENNVPDTHEFKVGEPVKFMHHDENHGKSAPHCESSDDDWWDLAVNLKFHSRPSA